MARTITTAEMDSRKRIAELQSRLTNAYADVDGITYEELLLAVAATLHRIASNNWSTDFRKRGE